jgi:7,8-dihydropterin-6-yl-methyl-4-(beta-D-ribofuranosyl)aminobenzene 5'-phosphate synthase
VKSVQSVAFLLGFTSNPFFWEEAMRLLKCFLMLAIAALGIAAAGEQSSPQQNRVRTVNITILSTNLTEEGMGEWGFAALVEADGHKILFDTGTHPNTVLNNAREMKIDLSGIRDVVLSHSDDDHTGGLLNLRRALVKENPAVLSHAYVAKGFFYQRIPPPDEKAENRIAALKAEYERTGGVFLENDRPVALFPGIWLLGPIPRIHPEHNWSGSGKVKTPHGIVDDTVPEDTSLVLDTDRGLIVLSGCCHAGIINTIEYSRKTVRQAPLYAAIGGFHLMRASDATLDWTARKLREFGLSNFIGAHCTGIEPIYRIRQKAGLSRRTCIVGGVGDQFSMEKGVIAGLLTH